LINFTQDLEFCEEFVILNGVQRIVESLKEDFLTVQKSILEGLTSMDDEVVKCISLKYLILQNTT